MRALILLGGDAPTGSLLCREAKTADLIIAADRGLEMLEGTDIVPDLLVGDMDSVSEAVLSRYEQSVNTERLCPIKDDTDGEHALETAMSRGADDIVFLGALGGRLDHALANLMLLVRASERGIRACLLDERAEIRCVGQALTLEGCDGETVSFLPLGRTSGITLTGFFYPLTDAEMLPDCSLGVSNVVTAPSAKAVCREGHLICFRSISKLEGKCV